MRIDVCIVRFGPLLAMALLSACSGAGGEPYYLGRWSQDDVGKMEVSSNAPQKDPRTGRPYLSVCYNRLLHDAEKVRALVRDNCSDPYLVYNQNDLYSCSLAAPIRATYSCSGLSRAASEARPNLRKDEGYTGEIGLY